VVDTNFQCCGSGPVKLSTKLGIHARNLFDLVSGIAAGAGRSGPFDKLFGSLRGAITTLIFEVGVSITSVLHAHC
jgi:hypothetical protein